MLKKLILLTVLTLTLSGSIPVYAKDNTGFTAQQLKALKVLNLPVIVAGWLPKGFKVEKVKVSLETQENPAGISSYKIIYQGEYPDYGKTFEIHSQYYGLGDEEKADTFVDTKLGKAEVFTSGKCVSTNWIRAKGVTIEFYGCDSDAFSRNMDASPISKNDAIKIIQNLKVMK